MFDIIIGGIVVIFVGWAAKRIFDRDSKIKQINVKSSIKGNSNKITNNIGNNNE